MTPRARRLLLLVPLAAVLAACGTKGIELPGETDERVIRGAQLFDQNCSMCHTLAVAGAEGSAVNVNQREYKDGPNFNARAIKRDQVLYAIRNGGFSTGPMPQNIVVGREAEDVALFLEKYAGRDASRGEGIGTGAPRGVSGQGSP